jgi:hypothetical protein
VDDVIVYYLADGSEYELFIPDLTWYKVERSQLEELERVNDESARQISAEENATNGSTTPDGEARDGRSSDVTAREDTTDRGSGPGMQD